MRKALTLFVSLLVAASSIVGAQPAAAVTNYTVTIVTSGGAAENANWTYANGEITPGASVSINASDLVAKLALGSLVVNADRILVNANVANTTANALTFKATGNIIVGGGLTISSQGGDIVFNSDSDANSVGHVRFGFDATCTMGNINSNGGNIIVGGGANPLTTNAWAQNTDAHSTTCLAAGPLAGVAIYNYSFNAAGGNISIRGSSPTISGNPSARGININSSGGLIPTFQTTGAGTISFYADGSQILNNNAWGLAANSMSCISGSGAITIEGRGNASGATNARGMSIGGASTFTSSTGNVTFLDRTNGALAGYTGINLGGAITVTTNGDFTVQADEISQGGALTLDVENASIGAYTTSSFTNVYSTGVINASSTNSLRIGSTGNTAAITIGAAVTSGGPLTIAASSVTVNAALTATGSPITFVTTAGVTQNAAISASTLNLAGTATYNTQALTVTGGTVSLPPDITLSAATESATAGATIVGYSITNAGGAVLSYSISPPAGNGLIFNTSTGLLSGSPSAAAGSVAYTITATNGAGTDTAVFTITVEAAPVPKPLPIFSFMNRPQISSNGQALSLRVENLASVKSIKIDGKDVVYSLNPAGELVISVPAGTQGSPDMILVHDGGTITMQGFIRVIKPYDEKRTLSFASTSRGTIAPSAFSALKASYAKGIPANVVSCVATVASDASSAAVAAARRTAQSTCQAMVDFSSYINTVDVQVLKSVVAGIKPSLAVTFDRSGN